MVWAWDVYLRDERDRLDPRAAPASAPTLAGVAPAVVITAEHDPARDDGLAFAARLRDEGVAVRSWTVPGVPHGFFTMPGVIAKATEANADVAAALRETWS
jgi:acetyl esterase